MAEGSTADRDLLEKRAQIDALDQALLEIVARRRAIVAELFEVKRHRGLPLLDPDRERALLDARRGSAERLGVPPDLAERIFQAILDGSHAAAAPK